MVTTPKKRIPQLTLDQLATQIRSHIKRSNDKTVIKGARTAEIPRDEITILALYLSKGLACRIFGGSQQAITNMVNNYLRERKEADIEEAAQQFGGNDDEDSGEAADSDVPFNPVPTEPLGIGGHRYANRLAVKVVSRLEMLVDQGTIGQGQQAVQASKTLLSYTEGIKKEAQNVMLAYEKQLILLAEHIVEKFLPAVSEKVKSELGEWKDTVLKDVRDSLPDVDTVACEIWAAAIDKFARQYDQKRFEIMMAESLSENPKTSEAFNITEELVKNFGGEDDGAAMVIEDEDTKTIRDAQAQLDEFAGDVVVNEADYEDM